MSRRFQISNFEKQRALFRKLKLRGVELLLRQMKRGDKLPLSDQTWAGPKLLKLGLKQPHLFNPRQKALPYTVGMHTTFTVGREREREREGWLGVGGHGISKDPHPFQVFLSAYMYISLGWGSRVLTSPIFEVVCGRPYYISPLPPLSNEQDGWHTLVNFMDHIQNRRFYF